MSQQLIRFLSERSAATVCAADRSGLTGRLRPPRTPGSRSSLVLAAFPILAGPHSRSLALRRSKTRCPRAGRGRPRADYQLMRRTSTARHAPAWLIRTPRITRTGVGARNRFARLPERTERRRAQTAAAARHDRCVGPRCWTASGAANRGRATGLDSPTRGERLRPGRAGVGPREIEEGSHRGDPAPRDPCRSHHPWRRLPCMAHVETSR